jgi:hypothetical protein
LVAVKHSKTGMYKETWLINNQSYETKSYQTSKK